MAHYQLAALIIEALIRSNESSDVTYNREAFLELSYLKDVEVEFACDPDGYDIYHGLRFTIDNKNMDFEWHEWDYEEEDYNVEKAWTQFIQKCEKFYYMITPSLPLKRQRVLLPKRVIYEYE